MTTQREVFGIAGFVFSLAIFPNIRMCDILCKMKKCQRTWRTWRTSKYWHLCRDHQYGLVSQKKWVHFRVEYEDQGISWKNEGDNPIFRVVFLFLKIRTWRTWRKENFWLSSLNDELHNNHNHLDLFLSCEKHAYSRIRAFLVESN